MSALLWHHYSQFQHFSNVLYKNPTIYVSSRHCIRTSGNELHPRGFSGQGPNADRAPATTQSHWDSVQSSGDPWELSPLRTRGLRQPRNLLLALASWDFRMPEEQLYVLCVGSALCLFLHLISTRASVGKLRKLRILKIMEIPFFFFSPLCALGHAVPELFFFPSISVSDTDTGS